jgi:hypothetical protein
MSRDRGKSFHAVLTPPVFASLICHNESLLPLSTTRKARLPRARPVTVARSKLDPYLDNAKKQWKKVQISFVEAARARP